MPTNMVKSKISNIGAIWKIELFKVAKVISNMLNTLISNTVAIT